jgi:exodeoxyribonuclease V alpha subunit
MRESVNKDLQAKLNPDGEKMFERFRRKDKVMCLKNSMYPTAEPLTDRTPSREFVANGELGIVEGSKGAYLQIRSLSSGIVMWVHMTFLGEWTLAYAITVHKSQGSQWPGVILIVEDSFGAKMVQSRESIYTAISRAEQWCAITGKWGSLTDACNKTVINVRRTMLREWIKNGNALRCQSFHDRDR